MFGVSYDYKKKLVKIDDVVKPADIRDYGFKDEANFKEIEKMIKEDDGEEPSLLRLFLILAIIFVIILIISYKADDYWYFIFFIIGALYFIKKYKKKKLLYDSGAIEGYKKFKKDNREYEFVNNCDFYLKELEERESKIDLFQASKPHCINELNLVIVIWDYYYMRYFDKKHKIDDKSFLYKVILNYLIPNSLSYTRHFGDLLSCFAILHGYGIINDKELYKIVQITIKEYRDLLSRHEIVSLQEYFPKEKIGKFYSNEEVKERLKRGDKLLSDKNENKKQNEEFQKKVNKLEITKREIEVNELRQFEKEHRQEYIDKLIKIYNYNNWRDCYIGVLAKHGISEDESAKFFDDMVKNKDFESFIFNEFAEVVYGFESFADVMMMLKEVEEDYANKLEKDVEIILKKHHKLSDIKKEKYEKKVKKWFKSEGIKSKTEFINNYKKDNSNYKRKYRKIDDEFQRVFYFTFKQDFNYVYNYCKNIVIMRNAFCTASGEKTEAFKIMWGTLLKHLKDNDKTGTYYSLCKNLFVFVVGKDSVVFEDQNDEKDIIKDQRLLLKKKIKKILKEEFNQNFDISILKSKELSGEYNQFLEYKKNGVMYEYFKW